MKEELSIDRIKSLQLDVLKDIHRFCVENNIKYSLAYGTLLGAVRHKGYIPWDDDIDIWMDRENYAKFMEAYSSPRYKQVYKDDETGVTLPYGKVYDSATVVEEDSNHTISFGLFVDVFPIDGIPEGELAQIRNKIKRLYQLKTVKVVRLNRKRRALRNLLLAFLKIATFPISHGRILKKYAALIDSLPESGNLVYTDLNDFGNDRLVFDSDCFGNLTELPFEDAKFYACSDYDRYLTECYGDYMKFPPKELQVTHHAYKAYMK